VSATAFVVGGAGSIGRALCAALAGRGYRVVILDLAGNADEVAREAGATARRWDITDPASIAESVRDLFSADRAPYAPDRTHSQYYV
jgi:nucleoside-diphosphate-sugar epimerase